MSKSVNPKIFSLVHHGLAYAQLWAGNRRLRDEPCPEQEFNSLMCYVIERYPIDENSGYTRQVVWIDQEEYRTVKIDYFDRKNSPLKT